MGPFSLTPHRFTTGIKSLIISETPAETSWRGNCSRHCSPGVEGGEEKRFKRKVANGRLKIRPRHTVPLNKARVLLIFPQRFMFGVFVGFGAKLSYL